MRVILRVVSVVAAVACFMCGVGNVICVVAYTQAGSTLYADLATIKAGIFAILGFMLLRK